MKNLNSREIHESVHRALDEVSRRLSTGELDGSGRFYTDEELARGAATGQVKHPIKKKEAPAA